MVVSTPEGWRPRDKVSWLTDEFVIATTHFLSSTDFIYLCYNTRQGDSMKVGAWEVLPVGVYIGSV